MLEVVKKLIQAIEAKNIPAARHLMDAIKSYCLAAQALGETITLQEVINQQDEKEGYTPLIKAAIVGLSELIPELIQLGADVGCVRTDSRTALYCASSNARTEAVLALCKDNLAQKTVKNTSIPIVNFQDRNKYSALMAAVWNGDAVATHCLLEQKADVHAKDAEEKTPIFWAINPWLCPSPPKRAGQEVTVIKMLAQAGAVINIKSKSTQYGGATPLIYSVLSGRADVVKAVLELKANVNDRDDKSLTALDYAIEGVAATDKGQAEIKEEDRASMVKMLLEAKPDKTSMDSAFQKAIKKQYVNVVKVFLTHSDLPSDVQLKWGIREAAHLGNEPMVSLLIAAKVDVNSLCVDNGSSLYYAAQGGHIQVVKRLGQEKILPQTFVEVHRKTSWNIMTAVVGQCAVDKGETLARETMEVLLSIGAPPDDKALSLAKEKQFSTLVELLQTKQEQLAKAAKEQREQTLSKAKQRLALEQETKERDKQFAAAAAAASVDDAKAVPLEDSSYTALKKAIISQDEAAVIKLINEQSFATHKEIEYAGLLSLAIEKIVPSIIVPPPASGGRLGGGEGASSKPESIVLHLIEKLQTINAYNAFLIPINGLLAIDTAVMQQNATVVSALLKHLPHSQLYDKKQACRFSKDKVKDETIQLLFTMKEQDIDLLDCWWSIQTENKAMQKLFFTAYYFLTTACKTEQKETDKPNKEWQQAIQHLMVCRRVKPELFNKLLGIPGISTSADRAQTELIVTNIFKTKATKLRSDFNVLAQYFTSQPELLAAVKEVQESYTKRVKEATPFWASGETAQPSSLLTSATTNSPQPL